MGNEVLSSAAWSNVTGCWEWVSRTAGLPLKWRGKTGCCKSTQTASNSRSIGSTRVIDILLKLSAIQRALLVATWLVQDLLMTKTKLLAENSKRSVSRRQTWRRNSSAQPVRETQHGYMTNRPWPCHETSISLGTSILSDRPSKHKDGQITEGQKTKALEPHVMTIKLQFTHD